MFSYPYSIFLSFSWGVKDLIWLLQFFFKSRVRKWLDHFYRCPNTCVERIYKALLYRTYSLLTLVTLSGSIKKDTWADSTDPRTGYQTTQTKKSHLKMPKSLRLLRYMFSSFVEQLCFWGGVLDFGMPVLVQTHCLTVYHVFQYSLWYGGEGEYVTSGMALCFYLCT